MVNNFWKLINLLRLCLKYIFVQVIQEFYNIFGPELKSIISDPGQIDAVVKRVETLTQPIEEADFDIFSHEFKEHWDAIMAGFNQEVVSLENEAKYFINDSFTLLRLVTFTQITKKT